MSKKENSYYLQVNALFVVIIAYCYYKMDKDEQHNNVYNYPIKTSINWTPTALSSLMLLLSSTTSLILALNPGRSNFHESKAQKYLEASFKMAEGIMPLATKYGFKIAEVIGGDRVEATQDIAEKSITYIEQGFRFLTTRELIHAHQTARSFLIPANTETNTEEERYLSKIAYITHKIDQAFILSVESAVAFIWNSGLYRVLNQYFHIDDKDTVTSLNSLYLLADLIKFIGTKTINNLSLATEIVIYGEDKSKYYKIEESELIKLIKSFANGILEEIKKVEQESIDIKNQLEAKILEVVDFKVLFETAEKTKEEMTIQLKKAEINLEEFKKEIEEKAQEIEVKILESAHLKEIFEAAEKIKAQLTNELDKLNHYFGDQIAKLEESARTLQAHWHGYKARQQPEVKALLDKKKILLQILQNPKQPTTSASTSVTTENEHKSDSKTNAQEIKEDKDSSPTIDNILHPKEKKEHHSFLGNLFHHHYDAKEAEEGHTGFFGNLFHPHHSARADSKNSPPNKSNKANDNKGSTSTVEGSSSSGGGAIQPTNKNANLSEKTINSSDSYISLITQKISEVLFSLSSTMIKTKTAAPKNKQQEEYKKSKQEAEEYIYNKVTINYENISMLEKPINQTQNTYQKIGQETMDMMFLLENNGLSLSMFGEEDGLYNQNAVMIM